MAEVRVRVLDERAECLTDWGRGFDVFVTLEVLTLFEVFALALENVDARWTDLERGRPPPEIRDV